MTPIDYTKYSDDDLENVLLRIDREKFPENYAALTMEIERRGGLGVWIFSDLSTKETYRVVKGAMWASYSLFLGGGIFLLVAFLASDRRFEVSWMNWIWLAFVIAWTAMVAWSIRAQVLEVSIEPGGPIGVKTFTKNYSYALDQIRSAQIEKHGRKSRPVLVLRASDQVFYLQFINGWRKLHKRLVALLGPRAEVHPN